MTGLILLASIFIICLMLAIGLLAACVILAAAYLPEDWR